MVNSKILFDPKLKPKWFAKTKSETVLPWSLSFTRNCAVWGLSTFLETLKFARCVKKSCTDYPESTTNQYNINAVLGYNGLPLFYWVVVGRRTDVRRPSSENYRIRFVVNSPRRPPYRSDYWCPPGHRRGCWSRLASAFRYNWKLANGIEARAEAAEAAAAGNPMVILWPLKWLSRMHCLMWYSVASTGETFVLHRMRKH